MKPCSVNSLYFIIVYSLMCSVNSYADEVAQREQLVSQWLQIEKQISHLENDWTAQQSAMLQSLQLLEAQRQQLSLVTEQSHQSGGELAQKRSELISQQNNLETQQAHLTHWLTSISQQLTSLVAQLPPPLVTSWQASGDLLEERLSNSEKLTMILEKLSVLTDFQQRISTHQMALVNDQGQNVWVKQLYLGASQAWFISDDLSSAGIGYASSLGWQWHFADSAGRAGDTLIDAKQIANTIAMLEKKQTADWVNLPVRAYITTAEKSKVQP